MQIQNMKIPTITNTATPGFLPISFKLAICCVGVCTIRISDSGRTLHCFAQRSLPIDVQHESLLDCTKVHTVRTRPSSHAHRATLRSMISMYDSRVWGLSAEVFGLESLGLETSMRANLAKSPTYPYLNSSLQLFGCQHHHGLCCRYCWYHQLPGILQHEIQEKWLSSHSCFPRILHGWDGLKGLKGHSLHHCHHSPSKSHCRCPHSLCQNHSWHLVLRTRCVHVGQPRWALPPRSQTPLKPPPPRKRARYTPASLLPTAEPVCIWLYLSRSRRDGISKPRAWTILKSAIFLGSAFWSEKVQSTKSLEASSFQAERPGVTCMFNSTVSEQKSKNMSSAACCMPAFLRLEDRIQIDRRSNILNCFAIWGKSVRHHLVKI